MNQKFLSELAKLENYEFICMEHHFQIARMIRDCMSRNALDEKTMADIVGIPPKKMRAALNGAYLFDLIILSKLQTYLQQVAAKNAEFEVEAKAIGFAKYKDEYPVYIAQVRELLERLDAILPNPTDNLQVNGSFEDLVKELVTPKIEGK